MTPDQVHYGQADAIYAARQTTLDRAFTPTRSASSQSARTAVQSHRRLDQSTDETA